ncbi:MAG: flavodoxin-dependent (E)-4-hydroxy-3-methylbut-2-enyl-diphosphate synthase [Anaerolineaceae bacterium]|nr:flavodoxin-dependent (E)-4-hydroxy-3-methylbut-2-enyl-diphosphate synthase [Anaerolineaceae bacterium]
MPILSKKKQFLHPDQRRDEQLINAIRDLQVEIKTTLDPEEARRLNASIRIGINSGSLEKDILKSFGHPSPEALVASALRSIEFFERANDVLAVTLF